MRSFSHKLINIDDRCHITLALEVDGGVDHFSESAVFTGRIVMKPCNENVWQPIFGG